MKFFKFWSHDIRAEHVTKGRYPSAARRPQSRNFQHKFSISETRASIDDLTTELLTAIQTSFVLFPNIRDSVLASYFHLTAIENNEKLWKNAIFHINVSFCQVGSVKIIRAAILLSKIFVECGPPKNSRSTPAFKVSFSPFYRLLKIICTSRNCENVYFVWKVGHWRGNWKWIIWISLAAILSFQLVACFVK